MPSRPARRDLAGFAALATLAVVFSVLQRNFVWLWSVVVLFVVYLLWRFVRAHERIADALAARSDDASREG